MRHKNDKKEEKDCTAAVLGLIMEYQNQNIP